MIRIVTSLSEMRNVVADAYVPVETEQSGVVNAYGRTLAQDVEVGDRCIIPEGSIIGAREMGAMAAVTTTAVAVRRRVRISVVTVGDNVIDLMEDLGEGQYRNTNRYSLVGHVFALGCDLGRLIHVGDSASSISEALLTPKTSDGIIMSVGPSADSMANAIDAMEAVGEQVTRCRFTDDAEVAFCVIGQKPVFALPFNAEELLMGFHLIVRPGLERVMGRSRSTTGILSAVKDSDVMLHCSLAKASIREEKLTVAPVTGDGALNANAILLPSEEENAETVSILVFDNLCS